MLSVNIPLLLYTDLAVSILPVYTVPADAILGPNQYRAASQLTLSCQATGNTGDLAYFWSSTCTEGCAVSGTVTGQYVTVSNRGGADNLDNFLRSDDAGTYTCIATDDADNNGYATTDVIIVGKLFYLGQDIITEILCNYVHVAIYGV